MKRRVRCRWPVEVDTPAVRSGPGAGHDADRGSSMVEGSVLLAQSISHLPWEGDNAWLRAQLTGRLSKARSQTPPIENLMEIRHFPTSSPGERAGNAVLGRNALRKAGRLRCGPIYR